MTGNYFVTRGGILIGLNSDIGNHLLLGGVGFLELLEDILQLLNLQTAGIALAVGEGLLGLGFDTQEIVNSLFRHLNVEGLVHTFDG